MVGYFDGLDIVGWVGICVVGFVVNLGDVIVGVILLSDEEGVEYNFGEV